jgi:hypothetical protein
VDVVRRVPPANNPWEGFDWPVTVDFQVPASWPSGLYCLKNGSDDLFAFVVRPSRPGSEASLLLHVPFLTGAAYSPAGGRSLYFFNSGLLHSESDRAERVSFHRPWVAGEQGLNKILRSRDLLEWLDREEIAIECCSSVDLHSDADLLDNYECLVLAGHDEYWTKAMRDRVERFVGNGGNLIVLSGNTCFRAVRLESSNRRVVFHKYASHDPIRDHDEVTVAWAEPPLNRPQNSMLGVGFTAGAASGPSERLRVRFPSHWAFAGITSDETRRFMYYEADAAAYVNEPEGYPRVLGEEGTPHCFTVLADADMRSGSFAKPGRVTMGTFSRNGTVFNAATTDWLDAFDDPVVEGVTRNVFARLKRRVPRDWEPVGHANRGCAMASRDHKLYLATSDDRLWRRYPVGADVPWRRIGHADRVEAMAGSEDSLFAVTTDNRLWRRGLSEQDERWIFLGDGLVGGTTAMAAAGGVLYAIGPDGLLHRAPAVWDASPDWTRVVNFTERRAVRAMTSYSDILFAATTDDQLLRTDRDWINESAGWTRIHHCNNAVGLAFVEWMLFVATTENRLWRMDMYGLRQA